MLLNKRKYNNFFAVKCCVFCVKSIFLETNIKCSIMKKINKNDLSLDKETISRLTSCGSAGDDVVRWLTENTCKTMCGQGDCPWQSEDLQDGCKTVGTVCTAITRAECDSEWCINSKSATPICCELPENSTPGGVCRLTEGICNVSNDDVCVTSDACIKTENNCMLSVAGAELSVCMCPVETMINCEGE